MPPVRLFAAALLSLILAAAPARAVPLLIAGTGDPLIEDPFADGDAFLGDLSITSLGAALNGGPPALSVFISGGLGFDPAFTLDVEDASGVILSGDSVAVASSADGVVEMLFATTQDLTGLFGPRILARAVFPVAADPLAGDADILAVGEVALSVTTPVPLPGGFALLATALFVAAAAGRRGGRG